MNSRLSVVLAGLVTLHGCGPVQNMNLDANIVQPANAGSSDGYGIDTLYQSTRCEEISRGGFILIEDAVVLEDLLLPLGASDAKRIAELVNFNKHKVLLVDFGASPSGGVTSGLISEQLQVQADKAVIRVMLPERNDRQRRQTQNVTHSCTFYTITKVHQSIQIRSQYDDLIIEF